MNARELEAIARAGVEAMEAKIEGDHLRSKLRMEAPTPEARAFYDEAADTLGHLRERWTDERAYEDIKTYLAPLRPIAKRVGVKLLRMTKRPFGVEFAVGPKRFRAYFRKNSYEYWRIA